MGDAVIVTNEKGEVILMNKIAEDLTGYTFEEVKGKKVREFLKLVSEQTGKPLEDPVSAVLVDGKRRELANHTLLVRRDGEKLFIEDSASPIFSKEGGLLGVVFVFRDVTEKVKTQRELMRLEKMSLVNRLAGGIAHDLNNLLSGMLNYIYLAYFNKSQIEKVIEALSKVENLIAQASSLTRRLLDLSKGAPLVSEVIDLKTFLSEIANFVFTGTPIIVYLDIPEDVMNLKGDPAQFLEIFQNLFINARDVLGSGGRVEIKAENAEEFIKISISDNGPGIPEEILPHIFEPFFTTKEGGTGLGLFIVKNIVENYGGKIEVYSEKGKGTTFVLYLPGTKEEVKKEERELPDLFEVARNIKVLIVDDEPEIRTSLKEILEYFGFSVETAENGDRALEIFKNSLEKESPYNLIITDFTMPGSLSGPELAKAIKEIKKDTKIIGTSGYIKSQDELREMYTFFEAILPKPYNLYTLKETLLKVLSS
ncbi:MAG: ATP-binding protein [Caldimicrobium sp.]